MKQMLKNLCKCSIIAIVVALTIAPSDSVCATNPGRVSATSKNATTRTQNRVGPRASTKVSTAAAQSSSTTPDASKASKSASTQETISEPATTPVSESEKPIIVNNKSSQFNSALNEVGGAAAKSDDDVLMRKIKEQREAMEAKDAAEDASNRAPSVTKCDIGLRDCMTEKCGDDFSKCISDSETVWGSKIDACRKKTTCSAHEYAVLAPEIKADRDMNVHMQFYNSVLNCGDKYNSCIFDICGIDLGKCLSKKEGDAAIEKCASIEKDCKQQDSGLAARVMGVMGDMRGIAAIKAKNDENRLYELRDTMRDKCKMLGAMFDERTFDCVFTVNFFAGEDASHPMSSKKLYAGDQFMCTADWFGIDVTTFKENAYRLTRSQTSASSAALGAGVGLAAGLVSSGAINRAIETKQAKKEYEKTQDEQEEQKGKDCKANLRSTTHVKSAKYDANGNCVLVCKKDFKKTEDNLECIPTEERAFRNICKEIRKTKSAEILSKGTSDFANLGLAGGLAFVDENAAMVVVQGAGETARWKYSVGTDKILDYCNSGGKINSNDESTQNGPQDTEVNDSKQSPQPDTKVDPKTSESISIIKQMSQDSTLTQWLTTKDRDARITLESDAQFNGIVDSLNSLSQ